MTLNRRDFLLGASTLAAGVAFSYPLKSNLGAKHSSYCPDPNTEVDYWGLCFTAEEPNSTISMTGSANNISLLFSRDLKKWEDFIPGTTTVTLQDIGDKIWMKAGASGNYSISSVSNPTRTFSMTGKISASGSINSLLNGASETLSLSGSKYFKLFANCTALVSAPSLPATYVGSNCYRSMFDGCSNLTSVRDISALTIESNAFYSMFYACRKLSEIHVAFTSWPNSSNMSSWTHAVSSKGTFYCPSSLGTNETIERGTSRCPSGWTVVNTDI